MMIEKIRKNLMLEELRYAYLVGCLAGITDVADESRCHVHLTELKCKSYPHSAALAAQLKAELAENLANQQMIDDLLRKEEEIVKKAAAKVLMMKRELQTYVVARGYYPRMQALPKEFTSSIYLVRRKGILFGLNKVQKTVGIIIPHEIMEAAKQEVKYAEAQRILNSSAPAVQIALEVESVESIESTQIATAETERQSRMV